MITLDSVPRLANKWEIEKQKANVISGSTISKQSPEEILDCKIPIDIPVHNVNIKLFIMAKRGTLSSVITLRYLYFQLNQNGILEA